MMISKRTKKSERKNRWQGIEKEWIVEKTKKKEEE